MNKLDYIEQTTIWINEDEGKVSTLVLCFKNKKDRETFERLNKVITLTRSL